MYKSIYMKKQTIKEWLQARPGYLKKGADRVRESYFNSTGILIPINLVLGAMKDLKASTDILSPLRGSYTFSSISTPKLEKVSAKASSAVLSIPPRRLFLDIETSPNIVTSWGIGRMITLSPENIIKERQVICVCWKWEGNLEVQELHWNKGNDKTLIKDFAKIINSADEIVGHNSDSFDLKWLKGRALLHNVYIKNNYKTIDTLKLSRKHFKLNSNKLDYIAQYLGLGKKIPTGYDLWKDIIFKNDPVALEKMITYCKNDVILLEKIFNKIRKFDKKFSA